MTNQLDILIALCKEYIRLLEACKAGKQNNVTSRVTETRLKRMGLVLRQTTLEFEKGGMRNDQQTTNQIIIR
ncbi:hypothetical protein [Staphylococcus coagulans]|uniref:hypothetical protein n=1 Tax=Staphylococcus coagulans TaxID=74706 RepID=UPI0030EE1105